MKKLNSVIGGDFEGKDIFPVLEIWYVFQRAPLEEKI